MEYNTVITLYHGTHKQFNTPSLEYAKPHRDFGSGFYLAQNYYNSLPLAIKNSYKGYVQTYELCNTDGLKVLSFDGYSDEWLEFVVSSRLGVKSNWDLVIGATAGGGVNLKYKFSKFRRDNVSVKEATQIMRNELTHTSLGIQYAFLTQKALSELKLIKTETIFKEE